MIPRLLLKTYYDGTTIFRLSLIEGCTKKAMLSTPLSIYIEKTTLSKESLFGKHCDQKMCPSDWGSNSWKRNWHLFIPMEISFYKLPFISKHPTRWFWQSWKQILLCTEGDSTCGHVEVAKFYHKIHKKKLTLKHFCFIYYNWKRAFINYFSHFILGKMIEKSGYKN